MNFTNLPTLDNFFHASVSTPAAVESASLSTSVPAADTAPNSGEEHVDVSCLFFQNLRDHFHRLTFTLFLLFS